MKAIVALMRQISQAEVTDDGIIFDPASFAGEIIRYDADYAAVRTTYSRSSRSSRNEAPNRAFTAAWKEFERLEIQQTHTKTENQTRCEA